MVNSIMDNKMQTSKAGVDVAMFGRNLIVKYNSKFNM